jgi:hypothetical protein
MPQKIGQESHAYKHGLIDTKEYASWKSMIQRCCNPSNKAFPQYGGKGVQICDRWDPQKGGSFENFYADMGDKPTSKHELDKDKLGDGMLYSPETCCWMTHWEQSRYRTTNHNITYKGKTLCIADWGLETGIDEKLISTRINRLGWSPESAITTPARPKSKLITFNGKTQSQSAWARELGLSHSTIRQRVRNWGVERALSTPVSQRHKHATQQRYAQQSPPGQDHSLAA